MTARQHPDSPVSALTTGERTRQPGKVVGAVLSGAVLVALNLVTLYFAVIPWLVTPGGAWDRDVLAGIAAGAFVGTGLALFTALLTFVPIKTRWLSKWWLLVPALLFALTTARWVQLAVTYPDLPDNYGFGQVTVTVIGTSDGFPSPGSRCGYSVSGEDQSW